MIKFILPDETHRDDVLDFYAGFERRGESCVGSAGHEDYAAWLRDKRNRSSGENLPEGCVRENFYLCYEGSRLVGVFSLKFELTDYLLNYGGHVGYAVRRSERNRGVAAEMLEQGLRRPEGRCKEQRRVRKQDVRRGGEGVRQQVLDRPPPEHDVIPESARKAFIVSLKKLPQTRGNFFAQNFNILLFST